MNTLKIIILLFVISPTLAFGQAEKEWTLEKCVEHALSNNLRVQSSQLDVEDKNLLLRQSKYDLLPSLNLGASNGYRWGRSIDPTTNQFSQQRINTSGLNGSSYITLFAGLRKYNTIKQNETNLDASQYDLEKAKNDVTLSVVGGYLQVIFAKELFENAESQLKTTKAQLDRTTKLVNAGSLPKTNQLDLQAQEASNEVEVIRAQNDVTLALLQLKQYLQIPAEEAFDVIIPEFNAANLMMVDMNSTQIFDQAENLQPEVKSADLNILSADYQIKIASGALYPTLSFNADIYTNYSDLQQRATGETTTQTLPLGYMVDQNGAVVNNLYPVRDFESTVYGDYPLGDQYTDNVSNSIGFSLRIPIFNGYTARTSQQRAKLYKNQAEIEARQVRNQLRQTIESAHTDALAAAKTYDASTKQVNALEESFRATERSYNLGAMNFVDYQVSSNNLFRAKSDLLRSKYDYIFKLKILDFYLGNPITL